MRHLRFAFVFICLLLTLLIPEPSAQSAHAKSKEEITVSVSVSPASSFHSTLTFRAQHSFVKQLLRAKTVAAYVNPYWVRPTLVVHNRHFLYDHDGNLFEKERPLQYMLSANLKQKIEDLVAKVESVHYAKATPWEQVKQTFGRMEYATVIDLETGERFHVQRRAGSRHADVQPLTRTDTQTMKKFIRANGAGSAGRFSWRSTAFISPPRCTACLTVRGYRRKRLSRTLLHPLFGSSTHKRKEPDPSHSLMIQKASGSLAANLIGASAEELVGYFLTALHEQDIHSLRMTTDGFPLPDRLAQVASIRKTEMVIPSDEKGPLLLEVPVHLTYFTRNNDERKEKWTFVLHRPVPWDRWRVIAVEL